MEKDTGKTASPKVRESRQDRLKAALKANLRRRKAQAQARTVPRAKTGKA